MRLNSSWEENVFKNEKKTGYFDVKVFDNNKEIQYILNALSRLS
jgi:hypothetical protein